MENKIKIYKIKKEAIPLLKEWGVKLTTDFLQEAIKSLKEENCFCESAYIFFVNDNPYLLGLMISTPGMKIVKGSDSELNLKHRVILKSSILEELPLEVLYNLSVIDGM